MKKHPEIRSRPVYNNDGGVKVDEREGERWKLSSTTYAACRSHPAADSRFESRTAPRGRVLIRGIELPATGVPSRGLASLRATITLPIPLCGFL